MLLEVVSAEAGTFILLQSLRRATGLPIWAQGGIGLHTAAAAVVAGARGVVLDYQPSLTRESPLPGGIKAAIARMDGSETICLGEDLGAAFRMLARPGFAEIDGLKRIAGELAGRAGLPETTEKWRAAVRTADPEASVWLVGQDSALPAGWRGITTRCSACLRRSSAGPEPTLPPRRRIVL